MTWFIQGGCSEVAQGKGAAFASSDYIQ